MAASSWCLISPWTSRLSPKPFAWERAGTAEGRTRRPRLDRYPHRELPPAMPLPRDTSLTDLEQDARADTGEPLGEPYVFRFATAGNLEVAQVIPASRLQRQ